MSYLGDMMKDEQGTPSMGRLTLTAVLIFACWFTYQDIQGREVGTIIYDFWQPVVLSLIAWGAGPRMAQYLAPIATAAVGRLRGMIGSSYSRTEVEQTTVAPAGTPVATPEGDDPVPDRPVIM